MMGFIQYARIFWMMRSVDFGQTIQGFLQQFTITAFIMGLLFVYNIYFYLIIETQ